MGTKKNYIHSILKYTKRTFTVIGVTLLALLLVVYSTGLVLVYGPSDRARDLFVQSMYETSAVKWLPKLFMSSTTYNNIIGNRSNEIIDDIDPGLISTGPKDNTQYGYDDISNFIDPTQGLPYGSDKIVVNEDGILIVEVDGLTYHGEMMIVQDPSRVFVATLDAYGSDYSGLTLSQFINKYDAVGGVNAGGFYDPNGTGNGGTPDGLVMGNSEILWGGEDIKYNCVIGFDENNILHVGTYSGKMAKEMNIVSAVSFAPGPVLIINGKPLNEEKALGGGLNPRTAIGQRADGAILILVVDGRQPQSIGATYDDLVDIMLEFGAINAANLDGGSSTRMHYKGTMINECASIIGERGLPNAILVKKGGE